MELPGDLLIGVIPGLVVLALVVRAGVAERRRSANTKRKRAASDPGQFAEYLAPDGPVGRDSGRREPRRGQLSNEDTRE